MLRYFINPETDTPQWVPQHSSDCLGVLICPNGTLIPISTQDQLGVIDVIMFQDPGDRYAPVEKIESYPMRVGEQPPLPWSEDVDG